MKKQRCLIFLMFLLLSASVTIPVAAQENPLPTPTGPHKVGVTALSLIDETRKEIFTPDPDDSRAGTVFVWYPANVPEGASPSLYLSGFDLENSGLNSLVEFCCAERQDIASVIEWLGHLRRQAFHDVPVSDDKVPFPVVIYSNIVSGVPINQSLQFEELASHGYIVIDVIHTFGYRVVLSDIIVVNGIPVTYTALEGNASKDILFILDQLDNLNSNRPENRLAGRFNLAQIGVVGYSSRGWPVIEAASTDKRIKAGISQGG